MGLIIDTAQDGLKKTLREHEELALRYFWDEKADEAGSRDVWSYVNEKLGKEKSISRATIINFLKTMAEEGVLDSREESGKGGYHGVYSQSMDERGYRKYVARTVIRSLMRDFQEETSEVLREF